MLSRPILALAAALLRHRHHRVRDHGAAPEVADSFGVSVPRAGLLVSGYALGVAVGAPIVAIATARLPRKAALFVLMTVFLVGNLAARWPPATISSCSPAW